jgi:DNA repair protein RadD
MSIQLRPYQSELVSRVETCFQQPDPAVVLQLGTGGGKTATASVILANEIALGRRAVFMAHLSDLIGDTHARLKSAGIRAGFVQAGRPSDPTAPIQVASLQTLHARGELPPADLVILDEAHRAMGPSVRAILEAYPRAKRLGLTATPQRGDGQPLGDLFKHLVSGPSNAWLTEQGFLVPCELRAPGRVVEGALAMCPVEAYRQYTPGRRAIVFASDLTHAKELATKFGPRAALFVGDTDIQERENLRRAVVRGALDILVGVGVFVEGFDLPEIEVVILARSFSVCGSFLQAIGRGLRPAKGKTKCTVLDLKGAWQLHGLPDERRVWSLTGAAVKRIEKLAAMTKCPECWAVFRPARECPRCHVALGAEAHVRRVKTRAEKLEEQMHLPQHERDRKVLTQLRWVAAMRVRIRSTSGQETWALAQFRKRFNREPVAA